MPIKKVMEECEDISATVREEELWTAPISIAPAEILLLMEFVESRLAENSNLPSGSRCGSNRYVKIHPACDPKQASR